MSQNSTSQSGGIGFVGLLTIVFITLKLTNFITWSWWWVLSPLWIAFLLWCALLFLAIMIELRK
jgi:Transmembrane Fragile-X-F protein.